MSDGWYWGVTARVAAAEPLLRRLADHLDAPGLHVQAPATAHVTLLYAPLRDVADCDGLAERVAEVTAAQQPFSLTEAAEQTTVNFTVLPPKGESRAELSASVEVGGKEHGGIPWRDINQL